MRDFRLPPAQLRTTFDDEYKEYEADELLADDNSNLIYVVANEASIFHFHT